MTEATPSAAREGRPSDECPSVDDWSRFHSGDLSSSALDRMSQHLIDCLRCQMTIARPSSHDDELIDALRQLAPAERYSDEAECERALRKVVGIHPVSARSAKVPVGEAAAPQTLGRYVVHRCIGKGSFGAVYQAFDPELERMVALKVPHGGGSLTERQRKAYREEARNLARLSHPGIVPVYDWEQPAGAACFFVSKYIAGSNLAERMREGKPALREAVEIAAQIAEALHYAHRKGLVHRDVKPANILLADEDESSADGDVKAGKTASDGAVRATSRGRRRHPLLADFGMALRDEDYGSGPQFAGTPSYMSPEQARGEGHLVDARTDVFSLGVMLYEMLTGRLPFAGAGRDEVLDQIKTREPRAPRQIDDAIPRELDRICLKALSKRLSDRYSTARDLADELRTWLAEALATAGVSAASGAEAARPASRETSAARPRGAAADSSRIAAIVPKGLRSFDSQDADFFLELLPGPRDRRGWPESVRFWITRLEATGAEAFRIGLLYGPSGCGKSSFVKAGLLPRLTESVATVYVEADERATESRLWRGLAHLCPDVCRGADPTGERLADALAELRRGGGGADLPAGRKLLLVIDQFEQWLHSAGKREDAPLVNALRQCDGRRVQCLLLVRDDFWMPFTRLARAIDAPIVDGENAAALDLFDERHAKRVLAAFGEAYDCLASQGDERERFLSEAMKQLSQAGRVSPVRLGIFVEMLRDRRWTVEALSETGGIEGIGATFLHRAFEDPSAPPENRRHLKAVRGVLEELMPRHGAAIKGGLRSRRRLLAASGYQDRPEDFEALLRVLDGSLRLITPAGESLVEGDDPSPTPVAAGDGHVTGEAPSTSGRQSSGKLADAAPRRYQLTHDYLVPSIRQWLTRKQRETRRGRAELRVREQADSWLANPHTRNLPTIFEWASIWLYTKQRKWTDKQRQMMARASWVYLGRMAIVTLVLMLGTALWMGREANVRNEAGRNLVESLYGARPDEVEDIVRRMKENKANVVPHLASEHLPSGAKSEARQELRAVVALAELQGRDPARLLDAILKAADEECRNVIRAIRAGSADLKKAIAAQFDAAAAEDSRSRARLALTLLYLGDAGKARQMLRISTDPRDRTALIHMLNRWQGDLAEVVDALQNDTDPAFQSGLCIALGRVNPKQLSAEEKKDVEVSLLSILKTARHASVRSGADWALRIWDVKTREDAAKVLSEGDNWKTNSLGATMILAPAGEFQMGLRQDSIYAQQLGTSGEKPKPKVIDRSFYISDREFTVGDYQACMGDEEYDKTLLPINIEWEKNRVKDSPSPDCPAPDVQWSDAFLLCNWLSVKEGLTPCYTLIEQPIAGGAAPAPRWKCDFAADGYRLPTNAEWEYACRAGSQTDFHFGDDDTLLDEYGVVGQNFSSPVRGKMPNAWGLFDVHGNISEWCWDTWEETNGNTPFSIIAAVGTARTLRGGCWFLNVRPCASGYRSNFEKTEHPDNGFGFRVVRTAKSASQEETPPSTPAPNSIFGVTFHQNDGQTERSWDESLIAGAKVQLERVKKGAAENGSSASYFESVSETVSDEEGRYSFTELSPGAYRLRSIAEGFAEGVMTATVNEGKYAPTDIPQAFQRTLSFVIFHDKNRDGDQDPGEEALGGWSYYLDRNGNRQFDPADERRETANERGEGSAPVMPGLTVVGVLPKDGWECTQPGHEPLVTELTDRDELPRVSFGYAEFEPKDTRPNDARRSQVKSP